MVASESLLWVACWCANLGRYLVGYLALAGKLVIIMTVLIPLGDQHAEQQSCYVAATQKSDQIGFCHPAHKRAPIDPKFMLSGCWLH